MLDISCDFKTGELKKRKKKKNNTKNKENPPRRLFEALSQAFGWLL